MIEKRGDGWRARVWWHDPAGRRHCMSRQCRTRAEAKSAEGELLAEKSRREAGVPADDSAKTFRELVAEYESWRGCRTRVREKNQSHLTYRLQSIADLPVDRITRPVLAELQRTIEGMEFSTVVKNEGVQLVRSVFAYRSRVYGGDDPAVVMHSVRKTDSEVEREQDHQVWTPEQFSLFMDAMPADMRAYSVAFETLFWTGMRRGELIALQRDDVDVANRSLIIRRSRRNRTQPIAPTKTKQRRTIQLDDLTWADVMDIYQHSAGPFLFGGEDSLSPTTLDRIFHDVSEAAGLPRIRIHDLRHSHATWLITSGVSIVAVSRRLGHASIEQTLRTYTHLIPDASAALLDALNREHHACIAGRSVGAGDLKAEKTGEGEDEKAASECGDVKRNKTEKKT